MHGCVIVGEGRVLVTITQQAILSTPLQPRTTDTSHPGRHPRPQGNKYKGRVQLRGQGIGPAGAKGDNRTQGSAIRLGCSETVH